MLPLNKLGLQLALIDEENPWTTQPGANQDYVIVTTPLMQIQVVRDTEHTYDVSLTPDPLIDRLWDRSKKTKLLVKVTARTLIALSDAILKRLVTPHLPALQRAREIYELDLVASKLANEGLKPFLSRYGIQEENVMWAGVGHHVASFYMEHPDVAVYVTAPGNNVREGAVKVSHLTMEELEMVVKVLKQIGATRWMTASVQELAEMTTTPLETEELSAADTESPPLEEIRTGVSSLVDDSPFSTS